MRFFETAKDKDEDKAASLREATDFLLDLLLDGPLPTKDVRAAARDAGHMWRTIERAKSELKILTGKRADGWPWSLPQAHPRQENNVPTPNTLADLVGIKKVKENQTLDLRQELRQPKNLGGDVGGHESEQNQDVNPSPPSPPRVFDITLLTLPAMKLGRARFERSSHH
jgi:hypothetical protein